MKTAEVRVEDLIGREVLAPNNRRIGRIEEIRTETIGGECRVVAFVLGRLGLYERLGSGARLLIGRRRAGCVARWDQLDLSNPLSPRLTVAYEQLVMTEPLHDEPD